VPDAVVDAAGLIAFAAVFTVGEVLAATLVFPWIVRTFQPAADSDTEPIVADCRARITGHLERFFLFLALLLGIQHSLTLFAALKVGSRLDEERKHKVKTDYFLAGNTVSVTLAVVYYQGFPIIRKLVAALLFGR